MFTPAGSTKVTACPPGCGGWFTSGSGVFLRTFAAEEIPGGGAGFSYQQQLVPRMRPGGAPTYVPFLCSNGPSPTRPAGPAPRRPPWRWSYATNPTTFANDRCSSRTQHADVPMPGVAGGMLSVPYDVGGVQMRDAALGQPMPIQALATALANAPTTDNRGRWVMMTLSFLFCSGCSSSVDLLEHDSVAKVTGMLLEMDQTEVLHLLESPEALKAKVAETMEVLRRAFVGSAPPREHLVQFYSLIPQLLTEQSSSPSYSGFSNNWSVM
ncbi:polyadenylate-binding protein 8-like [Alnus glutinosa]|uniref:polyadenylate-binding protein 8-like n=1 Tax=Alnus glutinosa TaxID=3517 RepID=UPI002D793FA9|nr:polyadenylate-binding protein 8-like [Alnus glutinosa]